MHEEEAEEGALFRTTEREYLLTPDHFERSEDAKLEIRMPLRRSIVGPSVCEWERSPVRLLDACFPFR